MKENTETQIFSVNQEFLHIFEPTIMKDYQTHAHPINKVIVVLIKATWQKVIAIRNFESSLTGHETAPHE